MSVASVAFAAAALLFTACAETPSAPLDTPRDFRATSRPAGTSVLQVRIATEGTAGDGYQLRVGDRTFLAAPNDTITVPQLPAGPIDIALAALPSGCSVTGENPRTVTLPPIGLTRTDLRVSCASGPLPPSEALLGAAGGTVGVALPNGEQAILSLPAGALTVETRIRIVALEPVGGERARLRLEPAGLILQRPARLEVTLADPRSGRESVLLRDAIGAYPVPTIRGAGGVAAELPILGLRAAPAPFTAARSLSMSTSLPASFVASSVSGGEGDVTVDDVTVRATAQALIEFMGRLSSTNPTAQDAIVAKLMTVASTGDPAGLAEARLLICQEVGRLLSVAEASPVVSLAALTPLVTPLMQWLSLLQAVNLDGCDGGDLEEFQALVSRKVNDLVSDAEANLLSSGSGAGFFDLLQGLRPLNDAGAALQVFGGSDEVFSRVLDVINGIAFRLVTLAGDVCAAYRTHEGLLFIVNDLETVFGFGDGLRAAAVREANFCGSDVTWRVLDEADEVRTEGRLSRANAASPPVSQQFTVRYGDRLVFTGRIDPMRCVDRGPTEAERLLVDADGTRIGEFATPSTTAFDANLLPATGRSFAANALAEVALARLGDAAEVSLLLSRESTACFDFLSDGGRPYPLIAGTVSLQPLGVDASGVGAATVNASYSALLQARNAQPTTEWLLVGGALPDGLGLSSDGVIAGIPSTTGSFSFTVELRSGGATAREEVTLSVDGTEPLEIVASAPPVAVLEEPYEYFLSTRGGPTGTRTWGLLGVLPPGLTLTSLPDGRGRIAGTPTRDARSYPADYAPRITVTVGTESASRDLFIRVLERRGTAGLQIVSGFIAGVPSDPIQMRMRLTDFASDVSVVWTARAFSNGGSSFLPAGEYPELITSFSESGPNVVSERVTDWFLRLTTATNLRVAGNMRLDIRACLEAAGVPLMENGNPLCRQQSLSFP